MRRKAIRTRPGLPYPLGASRDGAGVNFALFSEHATGVELCLFEPADLSRERHRILIQEHTNLVWHVYLPEARPGLAYGYRVHGPYEPAAGHRFNPAKLLLDPYAKAIAGSIVWDDGFRFDLAAALAREFHDVDRLSAFFDVIQQDPLISQVKLIAEPWDLGEGGYQVGNFPPGWAEWNGKYRDAIRRYWKGDERQVAELGLSAHRIERPLRGGRSAPLGQHQLRHRPRRIHARRPREL